MSTARRWKKALAEHETVVAEFLSVIEKASASEWHRRPAPKKWSNADLALHLCRAYEIGRQSVETGQGMRVLVSRPRAWFFRTFFLPVILRTQRFPRVGAPAEVRPDIAEVEHLTRERAAKRFRESADAAATAIRRAADRRPAPVVHHAYFGALSPYSGLRLLTAHTRHHIRKLVSIGLVSLVLGPRPIAAQATSVATDSACDYRRCALSIVPTWNGLAVTRGTSAEHIASLHFFFPHDIRTALEGTNRAAVGADSAGVLAVRALHLRTTGAVLTDTGIGLLTVAAARALISSSNKRASGVLAVIGASALGLSVPFQFAADGALSRAVWWHNLRYAR